DERPRQRTLPRRALDVPRGWFLGHSEPQARPPPRDPRHQLTSRNLRWRDATPRPAEHRPPLAAPPLHRDVGRPCHRSRTRQRRRPSDETVADAAARDPGALLAPRAPCTRDRPAAHSDRVLVAG